MSKKIMTICAPHVLVYELTEYEDLELYAVDETDVVANYLKDGKVADAYLYERGAKFRYRSIRLVRDAVRTAKPDLIHAFYSRPLAHATLATTAMKSPPRIVSFRGNSSPARRLDPTNWVTYLHPRVAGHACVSETARLALIQSGVPAKKCMTTYQSTRLDTLSAPGRAALAKWDVPGDAFVVATVATIRPIKRIDILLDAAIRCTEMRDIYWLLIGRVCDPQVARLAQDPRIRDRVRLLGPQADAAELISGADLFVMPSASEGLCKALMEAMQQGVCPIVSRVMANLELVRHGCEGWSVPLGDSEALAQAIRRLYADPPLRKQLAQAAKQRLQQEFSTYRWAARTAELYRRVLNSTGPSPSACPLPNSDTRLSTVTNQDNHKEVA